MTGLQIGALGLLALGAPLVVLIRAPLRQVLSFSVFGTALTFVFFVFQAPDVALAALVVSAAGLPVILILAIAKLAEDPERAEEE